jgi:hypothetical protein
MAFIFVCLFVCSKAAVGIKNNNNNNKLHSWSVFEEAGPFHRENQLQSFCNTPCLQ